MQIPQDLQRYSEPTLIVCADRVHAKFWLAGGDALEELDGIAFPHERKSDNEASFVNVDTHQGSGPEPKEDEERFHGFVHAVQHCIEHLVEGGKASRIQLVMDPEISHPILGHLNDEIAARVTRTLEGNLMKEDVVEVLKRLNP